MWGLTIHKFFIIKAKTNISKYFREKNIFFSFLSFEPRIKSLTWASAQIRIVCTAKKIGMFLSRKKNQELSIQIIMLSQFCTYQRTSWVWCRVTFTHSKVIHFLFNIDNSHWYFYIIIQTYRAHDVELHYSQIKQSLIYLSTAI